MALSESSGRRRALKAVSVQELPDAHLKLVSLCQSSEDETSEAMSARLQEEWLLQAIAILKAHWSRSESFYESQLVQSAGLLRVLPCSYLLISAADRCIGHLRMEETFDSSTSSGGACCACTFVIVDPDMRGKGLGRNLMAMAEKEATDLGYHYMYLWTKDAVPFYTRCGYRVCQQVSIFRPVLKSLDDRKISTLEGMLAAKLMRGPSLLASKEPASEASGEKEAPAAASAASMPGAPDDIWMRKRLREEVEAEAVPWDQRRQELVDHIQRSENTHDMPRCVSKWIFTLLEVPWQRQVGPSCALAAVRMARDSLLKDKEPRAHASLLATALERGITTDGEVYDLDDVRRLAGDVCGMQGKLFNLEELHAGDIAAALGRRQQLLLPYDADPSNKFPAKLEGVHAHCGIVVGMAWPDRTLNGKFIQVSFVEASPDTELPAHTTDEKDILLAVQHSASRRLSIASLKSFRDSNMQLRSFGEKGSFKVKEMNLAGKILRFDSID